MTLETNPPRGLRPQPAKQAPAGDGVYYVQLMVITASVGILGLAAAVFFLVKCASLLSWHMGVIGGLFSITAAGGVGGFFRSHARKFTLNGLLFLSIAQSLSLVSLSAFVENTGLPSAIYLIVYSLIVATVVGPMQSGGSVTIIMGLVLASVTSLIGVYSPVTQLSILGINWVLIAILVITTLAYLAILIFRFGSATLQIRLTTAFIAVIIIPIGISTAVLNEATIASLRQQVSGNVYTTSSVVANSLDSFFNNNLNIVKQEAATDALSRYLEKRQTLFVDELLQQEIKMVFRVLQLRETSERAYLSSYALLNINGLNVYDTNDKNIGKFEGDREYFKESVQTGKENVTPILFNADGKGYIYFSAPVKNNSNVIVGVLRMQYSALVFQRMLEGYKGLLGRDSYPILVDDNMLRLADTYMPDLTLTTVIPLGPEKLAQFIELGRVPRTLTPGTHQGDNPELANALTTSDLTPIVNIELDNPGSKAQDNLREIVGITRMRSMSWKVVYLQANFNDIQIRNSQTRLATLIASIISLIIGIIVSGASNMLTAPIRRLTGIAQKITMGDLSARSTVTGADEFGTLGRAFNQMTDQIRSFIDELEQRVAQRTAELAQQNEKLVFRSRQLQTVAEVARSIVSSQELQPLLDSITQLISERFGYYHVGIFLIDDQKEYAVLRAANSEGGKLMLAREHKLRIGRAGIVGYVCSAGEPRIATDVGEDSVFFNNPNLPATKSEMALPLKVGDQIIGSLDVQSTESSAFTLDDIELFATLADQVAVAIHNNQLYLETLRALAESQSLHRQYLQQEWKSEYRTRKNRSYRYTPEGISPAETQVLDIERGVATGKPFIINETLPDHSLRTAMAVPIVLRGETIGVIRIQDEQGNRTWSEDELLAVQDVAQQVGVALENARLFEKTLHRAEREKKVLEITGLIRSTNDPQQMLEIAAKEIQKALGASKANIIFRKQPGDGSIHAEDEDDRTPDRN